MRQIFLKWAAWTLLLGCMAAACTGKQAKPGEGRRIVKSKGLPSELLLVVDKAVWESPVADTLRKIVEGPVPGLPQAESYFRVTRILTPYYEQMYTISDAFVNDLKVTLGSLPYATANMFIQFVEAKKEKIAYRKYKRGTI